MYDGESKGLTSFVYSVISSFTFFVLSYFYLVAADTCPAGWEKSNKECTKDRDCPSSANAKICKQRRCCKHKVSGWN